MKDFFKMMGATLLGLFIWTLLMFMFCMIGLIGITASEGTTNIDDGSILRIKLSGELTERPQSSPLALFTGQENSQSLDDLLNAINNAAKHEEIKGIYIEGGALDASPAMLQELRQTLVRFKESKKFIVSYGDTYTQASYYVCSAADEVYLNPSGMVDWHGLAAQPIFYTDVLKKLGIKMQVFKVGTFKSAVEPYINTEMSEANREQVNSYLTSIWSNMLKEVSASRKVSTEKLEALADSMLIFTEPSVVLKEKIVDKLCYKDEVRSILKKKTETPDDQSLSFVSATTLAHAEMGLEKKEDCIAVYYAFGGIVDDNTDGLTGGALGSIVPEPMNRELDKLMNDESVKAVVIRVNSGGGSAYASEQIWRQISLLKKKKPVVVSMGGMAASGGYYISCNASHIVAEPTTLTGSIGIFGMFPDVSELTTDKIGLHYDVVKTNAHSDFGTQSRAFDEGESRIMQNYINHGYDLFTRRVAEGRKISQDSVKAIAEGRVWTGEQAKKIGLVDELGDLQTAIKAAAKLAKSNDYIVERYPAPANWLESIMAKDIEKDYMESQIKSLLGNMYEPFMNIRSIRQQNPIQARLPYEIMIHN